MDMKTSGLPPGQPAQQATGTGQKKAADTSGKSGKEFNKALQQQQAGSQAATAHHAAKMPAGKPFAPLAGALPKKAGGKDAQSAGRASEKESAEGASEKGAEGGVGTGAAGLHSRRSVHGDKVEALDEQKKSKREAATDDTASESASIQKQAPGAAQPQAQVTVADKIQAKSGLRIEELQSIVNRVSVGVTEKGKPEFRFEIQTHNLGNLDLAISAEGNKIRIDFAVQDAAAQNKLEASLKELSDQLQAKGLQLAETNFTRQDQSEKQEQQQQQQENADKYSPRSGGPRKPFSL